MLNWLLLVTQTWAEDLASFDLQFSHLKNVGNEHITQPQREN